MKVIYSLLLETKPGVPFLEQFFSVFVRILQNIIALLHLTVVMF